MPDESPPPVLFTVLTTAGETWQLRQPVPGTAEVIGPPGPDGQPAPAGTQAQAIVHMAKQADGGVIVFAKPIDGSYYAQQRTSLVIELPASTIARSFWIAMDDVFQDMLKDARDGIDPIERLIEDDGEDPDEPVEPPAPSPAPQPAAQAPAAPPANGASA